MKIERVSRESVYSNPWLEVFEDKISRAGVPGLYGVLKRNDTAVVIPVTETGRTILLNCYRYPTESWSQEFPMGGIEPGESSQEAAIRELAEETGLTGEVIPSGWFYPLPGLTEQKVFIFKVFVSDEDLENVKTPTSNDGSDDLDGFTIVEIASLQSMAKNGQITDGFTLSSILLADF